MRINTNNWNRIRYSFYTPFYNIIDGLFTSSRKRSIEGLTLKSGDKVLLVGAGTGLDLDFLRKDVEVTATDITPLMIKKLVRRSEKLGIKVNARVMDGQDLDFPDDYFDKIILHLIVAVIPDPIQCLKEAERVLKAGGMVTVFDKFLPKEKKPGVFRRAVNYISNIFFTDINRNFEELLGHTHLTVTEEMKADFGGNFRIILLKKTEPNI